jgi:hypothetical protein
MDRVAIIICFPTHTAEVALKCYAVPTTRQLLPHKPPLVQPRAARPKNSQQKLRSESWHFVMAMDG